MLVPSSPTHTSASAGSPTENHSTVSDSPATSVYSLPLSLVRRSDMFSDSPRPRTTRRGTALPTSAPDDALSTSAAASSARGQTSVAGSTNKGRGRVAGGSLETAIPGSSRTVSSNAPPSPSKSELKKGFTTLPCPFSFASSSSQPKLSTTSGMISTDRTKIAHGTQSISPSIIPNRVKKVTTGVSAIKTASPKVTTTPMSLPSPIGRGHDHLSLRGECHALC